MKRNSLHPFFIYVTFPPPFSAANNDELNNHRVAYQHPCAGLWQKEVCRPGSQVHAMHVASNKRSATHKNLMTIFTGEYGNANAKIYCLFEGMTREVFERKPCPTGSSKFGIFTSCLLGTTTRAWTSTCSKVFNVDSIQEVNATFEKILTIFKSNFFEADAPHAKQLEYLKKAKKVLR